MSPEAMQQRIEELEWAVAYAATKVPISIGHIFPNLWAEYVKERPEYARLDRFKRIYESLPSQLRTTLGVLEGVLPKEPSP